MFLFVAYLDCLHMRFCDGDTQENTLLFCSMCGRLEVVNKVRWVDVPEADEKK